MSLTIVLLFCKKKKKKKKTLPVNILLPAESC